MRTDLTAELSSELTAMLADSAPPSTMNVALARTQGRSIKRRRRAAVAGTGLVFTGIAAALVSAVLPGPNGAAAAPVASSARPSASAPLTTLAPTPANGSALRGGTDPLVATAGYGWLPSGVQTTDLDWTIGAPDIQMLMLNAEGGETHFGLTVLPAGQRRSEWWGTGAPAPQVNGHTAHWETGAPGSAGAAVSGLLVLVWEYAPNTWARLQANIGQDTSDKVVATLYHVAETVQFGRHTVLAAPFHLAQAPAGLPLAYLQYSTGFIEPGAPRREPTMSLNYTCQTDCSSPVSSIMITVGPPGSVAGAGPGNSKLTVDTHQATLETDSGFTRLRVFDVNGLDVEIAVSGDTGLADVNAAGGIIAYYQHVLTLFGGDQANWTTDVVG